MYKGPTRQAFGPFVKKYYVGYIIIMLICIQGKRADIAFVIWALPMNGIPWFNENILFIVTILRNILPLSEYCSFCVILIVKGHLLWKAIYGE